MWWTAAAIGASMLMNYMQARSANKQTTAMKEARDAERRRQIYQQAAVDPTHPWAKALRGNLTQMYQDQAASALQDDRLAKRRAIAAGNMSAGDTSRQDEANSGAIARAFIDASRLAQQDAQKSLQQAASNPADYTGALYSQNQQSANAANTGNALSGAAGLLLNNWGSIFGGGGNTAAANFANGSAGNGASMFGSPMLSGAFTGMLGA